MSKTPAAVGIHRLPKSHPLKTLQRFAVAAAILGVVGAGLGFSIAPDQFYRSYLVAFLFWLGFPLGALGILGIQYVTGGRWGVVIRRVLEASVRTLPLLALLFVPIVLGMHNLYEWTHESIVAHDEILQKKAGYLNEQFFLARAALYFVVWLVLAFFLCRWSREQDDSPGEAVDRRLQFLGRGTLVLYALTMTFAAVDWAMSLDPHWFSHIFGVRMIGGQVLTAFAFAIVVLFLLVRHGPLADLVSPARFHDLGNLLLAFVMLWAYFELSQFLIIWSGNLPEETPFYIQRTEGYWKLYATALIFLHFVVPFLVLLSRPVKRNPGTLALVAGGLVVVRLADLYWQLVPSFPPVTSGSPWLVPVVVTGIGGLWLTTFVWQLGAAPLLPTTDTTLLDEEYD